MHAHLRPKRSASLRRLGSRLPGPLLAAVALLAVPSAAAAQTAGVHAARAAVSGPFQSGDVPMVAGGGLAALIFGAGLNRLISVLSTRSATVPAQMLAGVVADPDALVVADSRAEASAPTAAAA